MSIQALNWALNQDQISNSSTRFVLLILCNYANEEGQCYPSRATIAKKTSLSVRSVQDHLNWLAREGYITWESQRSGNRNGVNVYKLQGADSALSNRFQGEAVAPSNGFQSANDDIFQGEPFAHNTKVIKDEPLKNIKEHLSAEADVLSTKETQISKDSLKTDSDSETMSFAATLREYQASYAELPTKALAIANNVAIKKLHDLSQGDYKLCIEMHKTLQRQTWRNGRVDWTTVHKEFNFLKAGANQSYNHVKGQPTATELIEMEQAQIRAELGI